MATEIVDVSLSASTSNGDEETYGVSHFSIYVGGKDVYFSIEARGTMERARGKNCGSYSI